MGWKHLTFKIFKKKEKCIFLPTILYTEGVRSSYIPLLRSSVFIYFLLRLSKFTADSNCKNEIVWTNSHESYLIKNKYTAKDIIHLFVQIWTKSEWKIWHRYQFLLECWGLYFFILPLDESTAHCHNMTRDPNIANGLTKKELVNFGFDLLENVPLKWSPIKVVFRRNSTWGDIKDKFSLDHILLK